jgi:hypothetical protein
MRAGPWFTVAYHATLIPNHTALSKHAERHILAPTTKQSRPCRAETRSGGVDKMLLHRGAQTGDFLLFGPGQAARLVMRFILVDQAPLSSERIPPPAAPVTVIGGRGREIRMTSAPPPAPLSNIMSPWRRAARSRIQPARNALSLAPSAGFRTYADPHRP